MSHNIDREEQERLRQLAESQKIGVTTIKATKKPDGLKEFLKEKDPNLDKLKEKYFQAGAMQHKSAYKP